MLTVKVSGLDTLQNALADLQRVAKALDGELATLRIDPSNPQAAVTEMENAVDAKLAPFSGNPFAKRLAEASKEQFRKAILGRVEKAKRESD